MKTALIYALLEPGSDNVRYIGYTTRTLAERVTGHMEHMRNKSRKVNWIKGLKAKGLKPDAFVIDEVPFSDVAFFETHYISLYLSWGFNLTNGTRGGEGGDTFTLHPRREELRAAMKKQLGSINVWDEARCKRHSERIKQSFIDNPDKIKNYGKPRLTAKAVYKLSLESNTLTRYHSAVTAARANGLQHTSILHRCARLIYTVCDKVLYMHEGALSKPLALRGVHLICSEGSITASFPSIRAAGLHNCRRLHKMHGKEILLENTFDAPTFCRNATLIHA